MKPLTDPARYKNHRFPGEIISHGVWLYYRFPLSYRVVSLDSVYEIRTTRACSLYPPETRDTIHIRSAPSTPVFRGWWSAGRVSEAPKQPHAMCALAEGNSMPGASSQ